MNRDDPDTDLRALAEKKAAFESFFDQLGFERWDEPTTDCVRRVCWRRHFPAFDWPDNNDRDELHAPFRLVLSVDYELAIGDARDVPTSANFDYYFEGVRLELRDDRTDEPLGTYHLKITTCGELTAFR